MVRRIRPSEEAQYNQTPRLPYHMIVVLGSGGHTAEMMSLMRDVDPSRCKQRTYIISSGDSFSSGKAMDVEKCIQAKIRGSLPIVSQGDLDLSIGMWQVITVPRARRIHQSLLTAPFSCLWCLLGCSKALHKSASNSKISRGEYPDIIVTNGPATAVILILAATLLKFLGIAPVSKLRVIYVESWARVKTLSLSGKILLRLGICEKFIVQWEALARSINRSAGKKKVEWQGFLVE